MSAWLFILVNIVVQVILARHWVITILLVLLLSPGRSPPASLILLSLCLALMSCIMLLLLLRTFNLQLTNSLRHKLGNLLLWYGLIILNLTQRYGHLQELLLNDFVCLTSHSEFINKGIYDLFNMYLGQKVLGQINHCLTDMKDLIVQVVRNAVAEHQQEVKQEVPEFYISMKHLWLDILKNEFQEIEHIEWRSIFRAYILDLLQMREDYVDQINLDDAMRCAL